MIKDFEQQWDKNKHLLEDYFRKTDQKEYNDYDGIVKKLFELCVDIGKEYYIESLHAISEEDMRPYKVFMIFVHKRKILMTEISGDHSCYDMINEIQKVKPDGLPTEQQVSKYMELAFYLLQKCNWGSTTKIIISGGKE